MIRASLQPASGPEDPPSSRPLAGVLRGRVFRFTFDPAGGSQRLDMPHGEVTATGDTVVDWAYYGDGASAVHSPYPSLAVTVDIRFEDGSRLSDDTDVRDRYDFPITAEEQFAARWSMPEQWNANSVSLAPRAGERGTLELVLGSASLVSAGSGPVDGYIEVRIRERVGGVPVAPADRVDTRRGSHAGDRFSRGNTVPAVAVPHGFTFVTPATDASSASWPYRPFLHDDVQGRRLEAVQFSHQPSPWIGDRGVLQFMPFVGVPVSDRRERRRWIVDGTETAVPHRWSADLTDGTTVAVTATSHTAAFVAHAASPSDTVGFVIDQLHASGHLTFVGLGRFEGWVPEGESDRGNQPRTFFAGCATTPSTGQGGLQDAGRAEVAGFVSGLGACELRVAISYLSTEQAWRSLGLEAPAQVTWNELASRSQDEWNILLGRVVLPPLPENEAGHRALADDERRAVLAHALYRLHLYPNTSAENTSGGGSPAMSFADPMVAASPHTARETGAPVVGGDLVVNNGYWDTYRTVWSALCLLDSQLTARLADGLLEQYRRGGWMTRWSAPGYVDCMVGTSSDQIFADVERWGVALDAETAFESGWRNACESASQPDRGRKGVNSARFTGFVERQVDEGMSWTLENAISDAGLGRLAERLASRFDSARYEAFGRYFRNRSLAYRSSFDHREGFFRGRDGEGSFPDEPFDPRTWGGDNVETNAWGMSVTAPHDGAGLASLYGGPVGLRSHLDALFAEPETAMPEFAGTYGAVIHEQREARAQRSGQCALSNQPAHHIPHMYTFTDQPWRAGAAVHGLASRLWAGGMIAQGFPGDEDNGEMSAWWLWALLGLYPLELASGELLIGCPLLEDVQVNRGGGAALRIRSRRRRPGSRVLVGASLNGTPLTTCWLPVDALHHDAVLELSFADEEDGLECLASGTPTAREYCPDLTGHGSGRVASATTSTARALFDNAGLTAVELVPEQWVGWEFDAPARISDVTVTASVHVGAGALVWEASEDGETFREVATTHQEGLLPNRTTPFRFRAAQYCRVLRVRATQHIGLFQLEFFALLHDPAVGDPR